MHASGGTAIVERRAPRHRVRLCARCAALALVAVLTTIRADAVEPDGPAPRPLGETAEVARQLAQQRPAATRPRRLPPISEVHASSGPPDGATQVSYQASERVPTRLEQLEARVRELESQQAAAPSATDVKPGIVQRFAALQPLTREDLQRDRTQAEQRIRDLEGLGPAPGTTSQDENKSRGSVPDKPTVAWTGELQTDDVMVSQSPGNRQVLGDLENFSDFRRARLGAIGSLYANTIYRLEFDFAQQERPNFLDVYGQLTELAIFDNIRIGHFFEPFAISRLTSNRYQTFMERPLLDAFAPARNLGVMSFSTFDDKRGTWQIGLFGADSNDDGEEQTDRGGEAVTGRLTYLPYWDEPSDGRYYMHVGGCFSYRFPSKQTARYGYWPGFRPGAFNSIVWPRWADTGVIAADDITLLDVEWSWVMGAFHAQAEYATSLVNQIGGPNLAFNAWYVEVGWFLTGESRPYQQEMAIFNRVTPFESFFFNRTNSGIRSGRGAWQVAFRIDDLDLTNQNIQGGRLFDLTFGLNWYLNPYTRVYFNYVNATLTRGEPGVSYGNLWGLRAQFEF